MPQNTRLIDGISLLRRFKAPYICRSCQLNLLQPSQPFPRSQSRSLNQFHRSQNRSKPSVRRYVSTTAGVTKVHAQRDIPAYAKSLHQALTALEYDAGLFVDISQLRLALRGLESEDAITRVAVLGIEGAAGARRLARVLLADPLAEEAEWEKQLLEWDDRDGRALLLRYGKHVNIDERHPLVKTLYIPSHTLQKHQLEIFVQSVSAQECTSGEGPVDLLVPSLETSVASSSGQKLSMITYPVHKSLLFAEGLQFLPSLAGIGRDANREEQEQIVMGAIDGSWRDLSSVDRSSSVNAVNVFVAEKAIESIRGSLAESFSYERSWYDSGLPAVSSWLTSGTTEVSTIKPTVTRLVDAIVARTNNSMVDDESRAREEAQSATVPNSIRSKLNECISTWSEHSHAELQGRLEAALASKSWRRLKWYKLPFRSDDVPSTLDAVLNKAWLPDSERVLIYLSGRFIQAGLLPEPPKEEQPVQSPERRNERDKYIPIGAVGKQLNVKEALGPELLRPGAFDTERGEDLRTQAPYDVLITIARTTLRRGTVSRLHSLAQNLSLQALSTTLVSTSISALLYVSISATSVYEAGAVAAIGAIWALRRLQKWWEGAKREWIDLLMEEGKKVLQYTEREYRRVIDEEGYPSVDSRGEEEREKARRAVERVTEALETIEKGQS